MNKQRIYHTVFMILLILAAPTFISAQSISKEPINSAITEWLQLGPFTTPYPAFHDEKGKAMDASGLLLFNDINIKKLAPAAGRIAFKHQGKEVRWKSIPAEGATLKLESDPGLPSITYLGVYIDVTRWTQAKLTIKTPQVYSLYLNGKRITQKKIFSRTENGKDQPKGRKVTTDLLLETGKHLLLLKTVHDPAANTDWHLNAVLYFDEIFAGPQPPQFSLSPQKKMSVSLLLDGPKVSAVTISPDATAAGVCIRESQPPSDRYENIFNLYNLADGKIILSLRGTNFSVPSWSPDGKYFAYTTRDNNGTTLWIVDRTSGETIPFLKKMNDFGSFTWAPDSSYIIYSLSQEGKKDIKGFKKFKNMNDRLPGWRTHSFLYKTDLPGGSCQRLTAGELTTSLNSISPDGKKLLFSRSVIDYTKRPYSYTQLYSLDLKTLKPELLWEGPWINSAQWIPDGKKLLIIGGPSAFGETGINLPKGVIPNDYDTQAYIFNPESKNVDPITKEFAPSIDRAIIDDKEGVIYFITGDKSSRCLYRYDVRSRNFLRIDTGVEVLNQFSLARTKPVALYSGSSATSPARAFFINLKDYKFRIFKDPGKQDFSHAVFGQVQRWTFKNIKGINIEGRVYYPPDFDNTRKYPCIVYYYGGTSPVTRDFGGRYPKNLWAANGYIIYVLQPSGTTGFGQKFSAKHVNDWGIVVADEIILGTTKFLKAHPFVDASKVGCIGASYGGFMTMLIQTRTNMFSAAVAHAGISSISSYWGEGYWGFQYSAIATANSFPWNRKDIYIDQSALFNADKISTPMLLLHGSLDTNVPPGESTQLFAALKLLGREVEYIQIEDQNHHIIQYYKRKIWTKTILAWFDKWLKKQPEWWASLYPE